MRKPVWARLLILVMLVAAISFASPVQAANAPEFTLASFTYPTSAAAGTTLSLTIQAAGDTSIGIANSGVVLTGPSKQTLSINMFRTGSMQLQGSMQLSPNMEPGVWTVSSLTIRGNNDTLKKYTSDATFKHSITITPSGQTADTKGPELLSLTAPDEVIMGDAVTITATAKDDLSGILWIVASVQPDSDKPIWKDSVELFPTGKEGEFSGNMLMDAVTMAAEKQTITKIQLRDKAGNDTILEAADLAKLKDAKLATKSKARKVPEGLLTSPYMNLIYPGDQAYYAWMVQDYKHVSDLLAQIAKDPKAVREQIAAELPQLRAAVENVRKEVYVDPTTKLRVSPMPTTGKWLVLDVAIDARMELLTELDRRDGRTRSQRTELKPDYITYLYLSMLDFNMEEDWLPMENTILEYWSQLPASYLNALAQSPEAVATLQAPANEGNYGYDDTFDRNTVYFMPIGSNTATKLVWSSNILKVYVSPTSMSSKIENLFFMIGQHFGEAYFSALNDTDRATKWAPYLSVRGNQTWDPKVGYLGTPRNNIGDDFCFSFLPMGLGQQYYSAQSYPRLRENPAMADAFKKLVTEKLKQPATTTTVAPDYFTVGLDQNFAASVSPASATSKLEAQGIRWNNPDAKHLAVNGTSAGSKMAYSSNVTDLGDVTVFTLTAKDAGGHNFYRELRYYRAPILLDLLPTGTNKPAYKVTGTTTAGGKVDVNGQSVTADSQGRFSASVTLTPGDNKIRVLPDGGSLGAQFKVRYEPEEKLNVKVQMPGISSKEKVQASVETVPNAIVTVNGLRAQTDSKGTATYFLNLKEGNNKVDVTVVNAVGNTGSWSGLTVVDTTAPTVSASVPLQTNLPVHKVTGKVEAGATLMLNGTPVVVAADGSFSTDVALTEGEVKHLEFKATDAAGNQATSNSDIRYVKGVPTVTRTGAAELSGRVQPGATLSLDGKPLEVLMDGSFSVRVPAPGGRNVYTLNVMYDGKAAGFLQYVVVNPLSVTGVEKLSDGQVKVSGKTMPGYKVSLGDKDIPVSDAGDWSVTFDPAGQVSVEIKAAGDGETFVETVVMP